MSEPVPESVLAMADSESQAPTAPLEDFLRIYEQDDNWWWRIACGHHQNLFDAAVERVRELELLIFETADHARAMMDTAAEASVELEKTQRLIDETWPEQGS